VTYEQFGAAGDGVTNDYNAIVAAHTYANENDLPVKAQEGAVYYVGNLNPNNKAGAIVTTDTDWTGAKFIIDDSLMSNTENERKSFLFTIASERKMEEKWIIQSDDTKMIGLDPNLSSYPEYPTQIPVSQANSMLNRSFPAGTTELEGDFGEQALYVLETPYFTRWGRRGYDNGRAQIEAIIVNSNGTINQASPIEWPWDHIYIIKKFAIDETPLYVKGGSFTTIVNTLNTASGCYRGIHITRSNTIIDGVEHYLTGEEVAPTAVYSNISYPTLGAPYGGFIRIENCAFITLRNLKTSAHKKSYIEGSSTAPYEIYAEYVCGLNLENCTDVTDIMDKSRWGTFATNYCKSIVVDSCRFNRVDAHMGVYNITVKNSTLGYIGLLAVGFGNMNLENCTLYSNYLVGFRTDYGSAWYGDVNIKNCTWKPNENSFYMFDAKFDTEFDYCYEHVDGYAVCVAEHINIDNLTVDLSAFKSSSLFANKMNVFSITTNEKINGVMTEYNQAYLNSTRNVYPHRPPKEVNISNLTYIINTNLKANGKLDVVLRNDGSAAFYKPTTLNYDPNTTQYIYSDGN
ncbi:MAG: hypothetical protein MJ153_08965, partial [Clostridia bacterium]|nr:hypothetical protein [Clostridia bacterium]